MTLQPVFRRVLAHAGSVPAKTAVVTGNRSLSYAELGSAVRGRGAALAGKFGVEPGDRVALVAETGTDFISTYFAVHSIGGVCVPLDPRLPANRLAAIVRRLSPKLVLSPEPLPAEVRQQLRYSELTADAGRAPAAAADVSMEQAADILLTTGTTREPKAVILSHRAVATAAAHINRFIGTREDAVEVLPLALHHSFGLGRVRCVLSLGATLVPLPAFIEASRIGAALAAHRATGLASVPAGIAILLKAAPGLARFADQLEYLELGSAAMPKEQKLALLKRLPNTRICMHYGLTEASRSAFSSFHDDAHELDSIGRPSPGVEMRIAGARGRPGASGEIEIRGDHLMTGYWQDPKLTEQALHDGWLRTGDIGRMSAEGYVYLEARADDVINVGGRKVLPQEVEQVLLHHPGIAECACVGVADPEGVTGEIVSAWLVPTHTDAPRPAFSELATLLRQNLEPYKTPRSFHWTDRIPKSSSGKVLRHRLREH